MVVVSVYGETQSGDPELVEILRRMTPVHADSVQFLEAIAADAQPDVVYLDPMYPLRKNKTALPRKEMRMCRYTGVCWLWLHCCMRASSLMRDRESVCG